MMGEPRDAAPRPMIGYELALPPPQHPPTLPRKPIHVAATYVADVGTRVVVICNDDTIWWSLGGSAWRQLPPIPPSN